MSKFVKFIFFIFSLVISFCGVVRGEPGIYPLSAEIEKFVSNQVAIGQAVCINIDCKKLNDLGKIGECEAGKYMYECLNTDSFIHNFNFSAVEGCLRFLEYGKDVFIFLKNIVNLKSFCLKTCWYVYNQNQFFEFFSQIIKAKNTTSNHKWKVYYD